MAGRRLADGGAADPQDLELKGWAEFRLPRARCRATWSTSGFPAFSSGVDANGLFTLREAP